MLGEVLKGDIVVGLEGVVEGVPEGSSAGERDGERDGECDGETVGNAVVGFRDGSSVGGSVSTPEGRGSFGVGIELTEDGCAVTPPPLAVTEPPFFPPVPFDMDPAFFPIESFEPLPLLSALTDLGLGALEIKEFSELDREDPIVRVRLIC